MAAKKKVIFEGVAGNERFREKGIVIKYDEDGKAYKEMVLSEPFEIEKGETKEVSAEDFKVLVERKAVLTKKEYAEVVKLRKSKKSLAERSDRERTLILLDFPHEV